MNNDIISSIPCAVNQALITLSNRVFNLMLGLTPIELELKDIPMEEMTFILNFFYYYQLVGSRWSFTSHSKEARGGHSKNPGFH